MRHPEEWTGDGAGAGHPDEGTIHAWLDGALPEAESEALGRHVAGCAECSAAVAEARGLIAASSQILARLDGVPGGVLPAAGPASAPAGSPMATPAAMPAGDPTVVPLDSRRRVPVPLWRRGGVRALAAAALLAVGATAVLRQTGDEQSLSELSSESSASDMAATAPTADAAAGLETESVAAQAAPEEAAPEVASETARRGAAGQAASEPAPPPVEPSPAMDAVAEQRAEPTRRAAPPMVAAGSSAAAATVPAAPSPQARQPFVSTPRRDSAAAGGLVLRGVAGGVAMTAGDSAAVVGRVVAQGSGAPVPGALVRLRGRPERAVTDSGGRFAIAGVPAGSYLAQVQGVGFRPESVTVRSTGDEPVARADRVMVTLRPDSARLSEVVVTGVAAERPAAKVAGAPAPAAAPAPAQPAAAERFVGCYRLSVGGTAGEVRDRIEGALPGWLRLERRPEATAGWFGAGSGAGAATASGARWQVAGEAVTVEWPADDRVLALRLRPWVDGLAGTAAWREAGEVAGEEVSVLARRVVCGG